MASDARNRQPAARAVLPGEIQRKGFVTPTDTNVHRHALCFTVKTWAIHKTTENSIEQWLAVDGGWRLVVGVGRRLAVRKGCL